MTAEYDIFLSHAWADGGRPQQIADALSKAGLRVWFDAAEINDFASITHAVTEGLAKSKALLAYYSKKYPLRRACQLELTAAFLAAQAEGDPRRRVLVISPQGTADHIHPIELRDAKFRSTPANKGPKLQDLVQSVVKHVAKLKGPLADIHPLAPPPWHGVKPVRYEHFVGRFPEMWAMHSSLHETRVVQITGARGQDIAQVTGLGGIGKSLLAREYALRFGDAYPGGIFWLSAYGNDDAMAGLSDEGREAERSGQLSKFAQELGIDVTGKSAEDICSSLIREIDKCGKPCLWIVDDLPSGLNVEAFQSWCAPHPLARTLITTRSREYGSLAKGIDLSVHTPEEAYQLLTSRKLPLDEDEQEHARALANDLGCHALALDVTAAALQSYGDEPYRTFREELADQEEDALELATEMANALPNGHEASITQTILRSIRNLGPEGRDFLRLASVLAVAPIPGSLVTAVLEEADGLEHGKAERRQRKAFHGVTSASLAEVAGEKQDARSVHTLVSRAVRFQERSAPDRTAKLGEAAIVALGVEIAEAAEDPRLHQQVEFHVAHARQVVAIPAMLEEAKLMAWVARYDLERGAYASAQTLIERALGFYRCDQGPRHPQTLALMNLLASTLSAQGDLAGSRRLKKKILAIERRMLGPKHLQTVETMNNLAETLRAQGDLAGARKLHKETLAFNRRLLGSEHPKTLTSMNNLALTLCALGDLAGARKLHDEALVIRRRVLGPEHPKTLLSMSNLAETLRALGDLVGARELQQATLTVQRRLLGSEHPETLGSINNLALTLRAQGDWAGARKLQKENLAIVRRVFGREHPYTSISARNLVDTLFGLDDAVGVVTVLKGDLLWLLDRDPATLGTEQREIRDYVAEVVG